MLHDVLQNTMENRFRPRLEYYIILFIAAVLNLHELLVLYPRKQKRGTPPRQIPQ
jgi:hypothetical protein